MSQANEAEVDGRGLSAESASDAAARARIPEPGRKLKILYHHRTASKDGQAVHIAELTEALRRRGHDLVFVGPGFGEEQGFGGDSKLVSVLRSALPRAVFEFLEFSYSVIAYRRLAKAYREHKPDVLYERFNLFLLAGGLLKRRTGIPYFLEVNAPLFDERVKFGGLALKALGHYTQKRAWQAADRVLPVTEVLAQYLRRDGVSDERISVIHNGIDPAQFLGDLDRSSAKARFGLENDLVLGFTGFLREWHGLSSVIELLADAATGSGVKLLIVGEGPGRADLEAQTASLGIADKVHFAGLVDRESIPGVVSAFDIALQPAATPYASPLKIFEYMALGCAIVAPRQANIEEILTDNESALLFNPGDLASMRDCVGRLCEDASLRHRLGESARQVIVDRGMTWDGNAKRIETLFQAELAKRQSRGGE